MVASLSISTMLPMQSQLHQHCGNCDITMRGLLSPWPLQFACSLVCHQICLQMVLSGMVTTVGLLFLLLKGSLAWLFSGCGGDLTASVGNIKYPPVRDTTYPHGVDCFWTISTSPNKVRMLQQLLWRRCAFITWSEHCDKRSDLALCSVSRSLFWHFPSSSWNRVTTASMTSSKSTTDVRRQVTWLASTVALWHPVVGLWTALVTPCTSGFTLMDLRVQVALESVGSQRHLVSEDKTVSTWWLLKLVALNLQTGLWHRLCGTGTGWPIFSNQRCHFSEQSAHLSCPAVVPGPVA